MGHAIPMHFASPLQAFASTTTPCLEPDLLRFVLSILLAVFTGGSERMWVVNKVLGLVGFPARVFRCTLPGPEPWRRGDEPTRPP